MELDRVASPVGPSLSVLLEAPDHVLQLAQRHLAVALGEGHVGEERLVGKGLVAGGHALEVEVRRVDLVEGVDDRVGEVQADRLAALVHVQPSRAGEDQPRLGAGAAVVDEHILPLAAAGGDVG